MNTLSPRDRALVALGAALAANCIPCIEHHLPLARTAGLDDDELAEALLLADRIRQVPARKVLEAAHAFMSSPTAEHGNCPLDEPTLPAMTAPPAGKCC